MRLTVRHPLRLDADVDGQALTLAERVRNDGYAAGYLRFEAPQMPILGRAWRLKGVRVVLDTGGDAPVLQADADAFSDRWEGQ